MFTQTITNDMEAVTSGLVLAVTAPTDQQSEEALELVKRVAIRLRAQELQTCKDRANKIIFNMEN